MAIRTPRPRIAVHGATALVTGAGSGIGRATALALAERGATVLCADIDAGGAEKTAAACEEHGAPAAAAHAVDVRDRDALQALADEVHGTHGPLGILVNNAGVGMSGRFNDMSEQDWEWIRSVNLDGVINGCAVFAPKMVEAGRGHVVNVSSGLGYIPTATEPAYCTTKAAVLALSQCLRADWAGSGVGRERHLPRRDQHPDHRLHPLPRRGRRPRSPGQDDQGLPSGPQARAGGGGHRGRGRS